MKPSTIRKLGGLGVIETIAVLFVSLGIILAEYPKIHAKLIVYGMLPVFVYSIAMVYLASARPRLERIIYPWITAGFPFVLALPFIALLGSFKFLMYYYGVLMIVLSIPFFLGAVGKKGSLRLSIALLGYSMLQTGILLIANVAVYGLKLTPPQMGIAELIAFPVTAIYAVSLHAVPKTYRLEPEKASTAVLISFLVLGTILYALDMYRYSLLAFSISFLAYPVAIRLYKLREWERSIRAKKDSPGKPGNLYFIYSHYYVVLFSIVSPITLWLFLQGAVKDIFTLIHIVTIGFIGVHIYIHAPMMVPVVVGMKTKRRYTYLPPLLLALAALVWPFSGPFSYLLVAASLCRLFDVILGYVPNAMYEPFRIK